MAIGVGSVSGATYFSRRTGNWGTNTTWSTTSGGGQVVNGVYPQTGDIVIIERGYTVTVNGTYLCSSLQVGSPGTNSSGILTFSGTTPTLTVSGIVQLGSFGNILKTGTITFTNGSKLNAGSIVLGNANTTPAAGIIDMSLGGLLTTGSLVVNTVAGNSWTPGAGSVVLNANNSLPTTIITSFNNLSTTTGTTILGNNTTITGNLNVGTGTTLDLSALSANRTVAGGTLTVAGTLLLSGSNFPTNFSTMTMTGGTVNYNKSTGGQTVYSAPTYNNLILGNTSGTQTAGGNLAVNGTLATTAGGTLDMTAASVLSGTLSTITNNGTISTSVPTTTSANPIPSGRTWGGTIVYAATAGQTAMAGNYNNMISSGGGTKTLAGAINISGVLSLTNGIITTTTSNLLAVTNTASGAITGYSSSSFVNGPLQWSLANGNSYLFPVGDATLNYRPFELNSIAGTSPVIRVTLNSVGAGTVDGTTLSSVAPRNWYAQLIGGSITNATIRLTETGLASTNAVAGSSAQSGNYTSQGGNNISGGTITSNTAIAYNTSTYFAIGTKLASAIALSDNGTQVSSGNVTVGTTNVVLHKSALAVTLLSTTLTGMTCTTAGTYTSSDILYLKLWYQTTNTFNAATATLLSTLSTPGAAGLKTFTSLSQAINSGTTGYLFITADIAPGAIVGKTININALTTGDFTLSGGTKSGTTTAGGIQTLIAITYLNYYNKSSGANALQLLSNWGTNSDGGGTNPSNFTDPNQKFNISNGTIAGIGAAWAVSGTNSKVILGNVFVPAITFTVPSGYSFIGSIDITSASSGSNTLLIQNAITPSLGVLNSGSTVDYNGTNQTVAPVNYYNLTLSNSGTKTFQTGTSIIAGNFTLSGSVVTTAITGLTIGGNITIGTGTTFAAGTFTHNLAGSWTNNGTFTPNTSTINLNGSNASNIDGSQTTNFNHLTINKVAGIIVTNPYISKAFHVSGNLMVTTGTLELLASDLDYKIDNDLIVDVSGALKHSVNWSTSKLLSVGGNISILGIYIHPVIPNASHIQMTGTDKTINTGTSSLSILTLKNSTGTITANGPVTVDNNFWASFNISGGAFSTGNNTITAKGGLFNAGGTINVNGGTLIVSSGLYVGYGSLNGNINFSGGTLTADFVNVGNGTQLGTFTQSGGTANISGYFMVNPSCSYTSTNSSLINITGNLTNSGTFTAGGTSTVTLNGNAQSINGGSITSNNLTFLGNAAKTFANAPTVNGILDLQNYSSITITAGGSVNYGLNATLKYDIQTSRDVTSAEWPSPFTALGGVIMNSGSVFYVKADKVFSTSVPLTINTGATLNTNYNSKLTFGGDFINNGTIIATASDIEITGTAANQNIAGFTTSGNLLMNKISGVATLTGPVTAGSFKLNAPGLSLGISSHTTSTLNFGAAGQPAGIWGGTGSVGANFINTTYFTAATGKLTVNTKSCTSGSWVGLTSTDWFTASNWCDNAVPTLASDVIINTGIFQPVINNTAQCNSITINTGATLTVSGTNTLTVGSGNWTNNGGTFMPGTGTVVFNAGNNYAINGSASSQTFNNLTLNNTQPWATLSVGGSTTTLNILGNYTQTAGTFAAPANMIVGGNWTNNGGTFNPGTGTETVTMTGTGSVIGGTVSTTFNNLSLSGSATVSNSIATTVAGMLNIGDGTIYSPGAFALTVTGATTVGSGNSGTLTISSATGAKAFNGAVLISNGGAITETAAATLTFGPDVTIIGTLTEFGAATVGFTGNLTNYGTYTSSTGTHTFSGSSKTIGGTNAITIPTAIFTGSYINSGAFTVPTLLTINGALTNNGTITSTTSLSGTGGLTQGTTGVLNLGGTSVISTLTATAAGNIVNYTGGAQTGKVTSYDNLTLSGSGTKTFSTSPTVNNVLSMEGTATVSIAPTYGGAATLQYNTTTARTAGVEWINLFSATGGIIITNTGTITLNSAEVLNAPLTINSGSSLSMSTFILTFNGNFINNGGTTVGTGGVTISGSSTQSIGSFTTSGTVQMTKTGGTATLTGNVTGAGLTINGTGGTLNLGTGLTHSFTGVVTLTAGTGALNGGSSTLNENATSTTAWNGTGTVFAAGTGTVKFGGGAQTLTASATIFNNLILGGTGTKTFTTLTTTSGDLSIINGVAVNLGTLKTHAAGTLTLSGSEQQSGSWGGTGSGATHINTTYFNATAGLLNVSSCQGLWIGGTTDWNKGSNWCSGTVPNATTNVTINAGGTQPIIGTTGGLCNNLTINTGASLTISAASMLTINGNFINAGTFSPNTNLSSTVNYAGNNQTMLDVSYGNLTLSGSGIKTFTVTGARTANTLNVASSVNLLLNGANTFTPANAVIYGSVTATNGLAGPNPANGDGLVSLLQGSGTISFKSGSFFYDGADGGVIPTATWDVNSTCDITGYVKNTNGSPANTFQVSLNQAFGNFTWDSKNQQVINVATYPMTSFAGQLTHVKGDLTISSTGAGQITLGNTGTGDFLVDGDFIQTGGYLILSTTSARKLYVTGDFSISGANTTFDLSSTTTVSNYSTVNIGGNFNFTSGTITESGSTTASVINFNGTTGTQTFKSGGIFSQAVNFAINSGAVVDFGTSILGSGSTGIFTMNAGGTLITANTAGITTSGASGSIRQSGVRTYNSGANYLYNGTIPQVTGNGLTQNTPANVTISNSTGVTFSDATDMTNLIITAGAVSNLGTYASPGHTASALYLNGVANYTGTWGGINSLATNINSTFFATNSGILTLNNANSQGITSSTTFTPPCGVTSVTVEAWGGGGAGSTLTSGTLGAGGGGGAYSKSTLTVIPGTVYTETVGQGGSSGIDGGDTWFGLGTTKTILAKGGSSATANSNTAGAGGLLSSSTGDSKFSGGNGAIGTTGYSGGGGSSAGTAAAGNIGIANTNTGGTAPSGGGSGGNGGAAGLASGVDGSTPGGGGGGAYRISGTSNGGNGGVGKVTITYVNVVPTITLGSNPSACQGNASTSFPYSSTTGCPDLYSINYDDIAQGAGFSDVTWTSLPSASIIVNVPTDATVGTYNGTLTVMNSSTTMQSITYPITISVNPTPSINNMTLTSYSEVAFAITPVDGVNGTIPSGTTYSWAAPSGSGFTGGVASSGSSASISGMLKLTSTNAATATYTVTPLLGCLGNSFTVTITINPNLWMGTSSSSDWSVGTNWSGNIIPADGADVVFATIPNNNLILDADRTIGNLINTTTKQLIIPAGKSLTVNGTINTNNDPNNILIQSRTSGTSIPNGTLIFTTTLPVYGTVEMYSMAHHGPAVLYNGINYSYTWQYFGIPINSVTASPTFDGSYVRSWDETKNNTEHWIPLGNNDPVSPFIGYEITQDVPVGKTIVFQGQLINGDHTFSNLSSTTGTGFTGQHIYANPYTAAIDIKKLFQSFGSGISPQIYLYTTGSTADWGGSAPPSDTSPGQYQVTNPEFAGILGIPGQIPSMQAFLVQVTDPLTNAYLTIPYSSVVSKAIELQRIKGDSNALLSDKVSTLIDVKGSTYSDRMWLFTEPGCSRNFNIGFDGTKILGNALSPQLYAVENDGLYQIDCIDDMNNTVLGFQPGNDTDFTFTFTHMNINRKYSNVFLVDLVENKIVDITENGSTYKFLAEPVPVTVNRFKIVTNYIEKDAADATLKVFSAGNTVFVQNSGNHNGEMFIYDVMGRNLKKVTFAPYGVTATELDVISGAYIVNAATSTEKVSKKIIIKK